MFSSQSNLEILYQVLDEYTIQASQSITIPPELENYQFSKRFEKRMQRLINRQKKSYYMLIDTVAKRVAGYVLVVLACLLVTVFSVKALREPFISFVVQTYEKFTSIFVDKDTIDIRAANTEFKIMLPTYIPEGYEVEEEITNANFNFVTYKNTEGNYIHYKQNIYDSWYITANTENTNYKKILINKCEGMLYYNNGVNSLIIYNNGYTFCIEGEISKEEIINVAKSIK